MSAAGCGGVYAGDYCAEWRYVEGVHDPCAEYLQLAMTAVGMETLEAQDEHGTEIDREPGTDYVFKSEGRRTWFVFPDASGARQFRHQWIRKRRCRSHVPTFLSSPMSQKAQW